MFEVRSVVSLEEEETLMTQRKAYGVFCSAVTVLYFAVGGHYIGVFTLWKFIEQNPMSYAVFCVYVLQTVRVHIKINL